MTNLSSKLTFHHVCLEVDGLESAAKSLAATLGAGPFYGMENVTFDELEYADGDCTFDHSLAFGYIGSQIVELSELHTVEPAGLAKMLHTRPVQHLSYLVDDLKAEAAVLEANGARRVLYGRNGPVELVYFEVPEAGTIELIQANEFFTGFCAAIAAKAVDWDGSEPYRSASSLG